MLKNIDTTVFKVNIVDIEMLNDIEAPSFLRHFSLTIVYIHKRYCIVGRHLVNIKTNKNIDVSLMQYLNKYRQYPIKIVDDDDAKDVK